MSLTNQPELWQSVRVDQDVGAFCVEAGDLVEYRCYCGCYTILCLVYFAGCGRVIVT